MESSFKKLESSSNFFIDQFVAAQNLFSGFEKYNNDFMAPYLTSIACFGQAELSKMDKSSFCEQWESYVELLKFNMDLMGKGFSGSMQAMDGVVNRELENYLLAFKNSILQGEGEKLDDFFSRLFDMLSGVSKRLPKAIKEIEPEFGFHFERGINPLFAETDRFLLYRIVPTNKDIKMDEKGKPIIIIPPFVLGSNILSFLPGDNKSYTHCYANQGIPTYIRIMKDIQTTEAFQTMTMEEDALDTRYFCEKVMEQHGKKVTLNGYCQGGFSAVCDILSNELDHVVDALITCVAPMDGTRSKGLGDFLKTLPPRFNDLIYGTKRLPSGNEVADGQLMGWVYKIKSIEDQAPIVSFLRDMFMVSQMEKKSGDISKTAAALNYWLQNERSDIPLSITQMSFASFNIPVTKDGTLPVEMFGRKLNFKGIEEKKIPWLLCYGENDDLVEKDSALAPLDYIDVETAPFPKGHVAIATSWSDPESAYALHKRFGQNDQYRGPVRFQMDLNEAIDKSIQQEKAARLAELEKPEPEIKAKTESIKKAVVIDIVKPAKVEPIKKAAVKTTAKPALIKKTAVKAVAKPAKVNSIKKAPKKTK
ncbi:MAG: metal transporter [Pseudomonadota bacterium]